ncbi:hypothetical protein HA402_007257 [Bradysia odoriphaga]|nr:hypothetical protein HA402_007257 [Bradysia odoriphaga]
MDEKEIFAKTVYLEARGESDEGCRAVGHVIKNRAKLNKDYWGGRSIRDVCLQPGQFECWDSGQNTEIKERSRYDQIKRITGRIYDGNDADPTGGADHYNNPDKEGYKSWMKNCDRKKKIGNHQFYKTKPEFM